MIRRLWREALAEVVYAFDLDDGRGNPSMTKVIALVYVALFVVSVLLGKAVSGTQLTLAIVAAAIAFGRSTFTKWLERGRWSTSVREEIRREDVTITARRDPAAGIERSGRVQEPLGD